ncbi:MAG: FtsW/RodA/SpoVE family cell cycle protein [Candidatus Limnocylindria bacterium]
MGGGAIAWRWTELRLLLPVAILVPLGFAITNAALTGTSDAGPLTLPLVYVLLFVFAHVILMVTGHRGDQLLLPIVATIAGIGIVVLNRLPQELAGTHAFGLELGMAPTQLLWIAVGLAVMLGAAIGFRDDRVLRHYKYTWAFVGILLLVATFLFGYEVGGARLWLDVGPLNVQPGEAIKVLLVIFIARYLAEKRPLLAGAAYRVGPISLPPLPYLLPMVAMFVIVMLIVIFSRDLGAALLFLGIFLTMLFVATGRRSYVVLGLLLFIVGSYVAYRLFEHVQVRVDNWIDPFADPSGRGYQPVQALYAFARGGLFGEGLGRGLPLIDGRLPIPALHTDFIFAGIAEELGLVGAFALLGFFLALVFRGLRTAMLAHDDFASLLATGLTASVGIQTLIIVSGNARLAPLTGITLPFVSYGGSSVIASFAVIGLLLAISHRSAVSGPSTA